MADTKEEQGTETGTTATASGGVSVVAEKAVAEKTLRKVTVNFAPETYSMLESVAKARNVNMSEAIRQAIGLLSLYVDTSKAGSRILIDRNGQINELRIL